MTETPDQIAARLGVGLAPGVAVRCVPMGVSGLPQPIWDEKTKVWRMPGWKDYQARVAAQNLAVHRRQMRLRPPQVRVARPLAEMRAARVAEMVSLGHARSDIARDIGVSLSSLCAIARHAGIVLPEPVRPSRAKVRTAPPPSDVVVTPRMPLPVILDAVAAEFKTQQAAILGKSRTAEVAAARQRVMRLGLEAGWRSTEVAAFLGRDHSTVLHGAEQDRARAVATLPETRSEVAA